MINSCFIVAGDYINAISVWDSLKALQVRGQIYFLNLSKRNMVGRIYPKCTVLDIDNVESLLSFLESLEKKSTKYLFLTCDLFHESLWKNNAILDELNVVVHMGYSDPSRILDKKKFLEIIRKETDVPVPKSYSSFEIDKINAPVCLKLKTSYISGKIVPKGVDIYSIAQVKKYIALFQEKGYDLEDIEIQELLSTKAQDNISVCGWYDPSFHTFYQTRKILQHPPKIGTGDVVEYMLLNKTLADYTLKILKAIDYKGPFEMEYIKSRNDEIYKLIEMNPRFWMQHGLIEQISGHLIIAKYLEVMPLQPKVECRYWMYPVISLLQLAKGKLKYIPFFFRKDVYKPISIKQTIKFIISYIFTI